MYKNKIMQKVKWLGDKLMSKKPVTATPAKAPAPEAVKTVLLKAKPLPTASTPAKQAIQPDNDAKRLQAEIDSLKAMLKDSETSLKATRTLAVEYKDKADKYAETEKKNSGIDIQANQIYFLSFGYSRDAYYLKYVNGVACVNMGNGWRWVINFGENANHEDMSPLQLSLDQFKTLVNAKLDRKNLALNYRLFTPNRTDFMGVCNKSLWLNTTQDNESYSKAIKIN